jgi:hypothetical protein
MELQKKKEVQKAAIAGYNRNKTLVEMQFPLTEGKRKTWIVQCFSWFDSPVTIAHFCTNVKCVI